MMRRLADRGIAVVFITHKLREAFDFGDRISILRLGRKVAELTPEELSGGHRAAIAAEKASKAGDDAVALHHLRRWAYGMAVILVLLVVAPWDMVFKPGL